MEKKEIPQRAPYEKKAREIMKKLGIGLVMKTGPGQDPEAMAQTLKNLEQAVLEMRDEDDAHFLEGENVLVCPEEIIVDRFKNRLKSPQLDRRAVIWNSSVEAIKDQLESYDMLPAIKKEIERLDEKDEIRIQAEFSPGMSLAALRRLKDVILEIRQEKKSPSFPEDAVYVVADKETMRKRQEADIASGDYFALQYFVGWDDSREEMKKEILEVMEIMEELDSLTEDTLSEEDGAL